MSRLSNDRSALIVIASGYQQPVSSMLPYHRRFTNSCSPDKQSSFEDGRVSNVENDEKSIEKRKVVENKDNHDVSNNTTPLNQQATNAILTQLLSPPNILTMSRILATPYLSYLLISHHHYKSVAASSLPVGGDTVDTAVSSTVPGDAAASIDATTAPVDTLSVVAANLDQSSTPAIALSLFLLLGFTDFLDGYIARKYPSTATVLGTYLDPFADKFFISIMSLTMWHTGSLPGLLVGLWIARDVGIVGSVYWLVRKETVRKQSSKCQDGVDSEGSNNMAVMDPQNTPLKVQASFMSKVNTALQIGLIALGIAGEVPMVDIPPELMISLIWITAGTTIGSTLGYVDGSAFKKTGNK